MEYNINYINLKYTLINCFLVKADKNVLDISYSCIDEKKVLIQVVLLDGFTLAQEKIENIKQRLNNYDVVVTELYLTKERFNECKGEWQPRYYQWLDNLLFSKAEVL